MIFSIPRLIQSASLVLALYGVQASSAQSLDLSFSLPDAPSYSSSLQQPTQAPTAQAPATQTQAPQNETEEQRKARELREEAEREVKAQEKQRVGGVMPEFNVVLNGKAVPLTPKQKFDLSFHTIIDPYTFALAFIFGGGLGELEDSHTGYGHGTAGFFKRVGASYADNVDGNVIGNALLPIILHQDPRYFRKGEGTVKSRIYYSAMTSFICHSDKGKLQFNYSNVGGNFIAGAISNAYYPQDERGVGLTIDNAIFVTLEGMLGAQILEFSPDITDKIKRHNQRKREEKAAAAAAKTGSPAPVPAPQP